MVTFINCATDYLTLQFIVIDHSDDGFFRSRGHLGAVGVWLISRGSWHAGERKNDPPKFWICLHSKSNNHTLFEILKIVVNNIFMSILS